MTLPPGHVPATRARDRADERVTGPQPAAARAVQRWPNHPLARCRPHQLTNRGRHTSKLDRASAVTDLDSDECQAGCSSAVSLLRCSGFLAYI
jgi:hypothetical protein